MNCNTCGGFIDKDAAFCLECGTRIEEMKPNQESESPNNHSMICPICGNQNQPKESFKCPGCQDNFLCLSHRVKNSRYDPDIAVYVSEYYCTRCWKALGFTTFTE